MIDRGLNQDNINKKLAHSKRKLLNPSGFFMADKITKDPLGFDELVLEKLNILKNQSSGIKIQGGKIISADGKHVLIMATPAFPAVDTKQSKDMIGFLNSIRSEINTEFKGMIKAGFSGNHIATYDNSISIQKDVKRAVTILSIGIVCIGLVFFRRKVFIVLVFLPTIISLTAASALLSIFNSSVSAIALGCGAVLVGITVDFGIHILFGVDNNEANNKKNNISKIIKNLRLPIATGAFTTLTAFTCLLFSSLPGQRQMGLFSLTGVLCAAFFASFILKYFIPQINNPEKKPLISLVLICKNLIKFRDRYKNQLLALCLAVFIICLFGLKNFKFDGDVANLNHLSPVVKQDTDSFLNTWGGFSPSIVLVKGENLEHALLKNDELFHLLLKMQKTKTISKIASLSTIFPSSSTKKENIRAWNNFISGEKKDSIKVMVNKAALDLGFSKNVFKPFFTSLDERPQELVITDFKNTAINKLIKEKIIINKDNALVMTTFNINNRSEIINIRDEIKLKIPGSMFLDKRSFVENTTGLVAKEFKKLLFFAAAGMIISLLIFMRNIKIVIVTIIPVFLSVVITAGILGFLGIPVNLISILFIIFVFGVGVDFSIFLINKELSVFKKTSIQEIAVTLIPVLAQKIIFKQRIT